ncbi:MAG: tetratricopeptide repeat protein [Nitrospiraceae bacterium]
MNARSVRHVLVIGLLTFCTFTGCSSSPSRETKGPLTAQMRDLHARGQRFLQQGDADRAKRSFHQSKRLAESLDDLEGLAQALNDLGTIAVAESMPAHAVSLHRQALAISERLNQPHSILLSLSGLATALHRSGQVEESTG